MPLDYSITYQGQLIEVTVRGSPDYLSLNRLWHDISGACSKNDCFKILGVSHTEDWGEYEPYDHAAIFEAAGVTTGHRIAWIEENANSKRSIKLAEAVVTHRRLATARVFDSLKEAKRWLMEETMTL